MTYILCVQCFFVMERAGMAYRHHFQVMKEIVTFNLGW